MKKRESKVGGAEEGNLRGKNVGSVCTFSIQEGKVATEEVF